MSRKNRFNLISTTLLRLIQTKNQLNVKCPIVSPWPVCRPLSSAPRFTACPDVMLSPNAHLHVTYCLFVYLTSSGERFTISAYGNSLGRNRFAGLPALRGDSGRAVTHEALMTLMDGYCRNVEMHGRSYIPRGAVRRETIGILVMVE